MKRLLPFILMIVYTTAANGQAANLYEDFESACTTTAGFPSDWTYYNPIAATMPDGQWTCAPHEGRYGSNGISCTSVWGSPAMYHFDTSYLLTPALNLSGYAGSIYLRFDTKTSNINLAGRLSFTVSSSDTVFDTTGGALFADRTSELSPTFSNDDSTEWVTHVADLTPYKNAIPLYVAFRYTADNASGSTWFIDNVYITPYVEYVPQLNKDALSVSVVGTSTSSRITLLCETGSSGSYHLGIYDMLGREVYQEEMQLSGSKTSYPINGLNLTTGLYLVKMNNGVAYCTAKAVVY